MLSKKNILYAAGAALVMMGCQAGGNDPGVEYSPQMYHAVSYEPLTQFSEKEIPSNVFAWYYADKVNSTPYNDYKGAHMSNSLTPVKGTVPRQNFSAVTGSNVAKPGQELLIYNLHPDDFVMAGAVLKNPVPATEAIVEQGKHLYLGFCAPCHGAQGDGKGKVGGVYGGVANFQAGAYKNLPEGHIFHVITHGKGRMWSHKTQLNPEERWKIVRYVQKLQKGEM